MRYVIYIDVFFLVNLLMDFIIICLSKKLINPQTTSFRCFLGAVAYVYIITFTLGGILNVLYYHTYLGVIFNQTITGYINGRLSIVKLIGFVLLSCGSKIYIRQFRQRIFRKI